MMHCLVTNISLTFMVNNTFVTFIYNHYLKLPESGFEKSYATLHDASSLFLRSIEGSLYC